MKKWMNSLLAFASVLLTSTLAFAQDGSSDGPWVPVGIGIGIGMAVLGGALGQGRVASAALEGVARNPNAAGSMQVPLILGLALIESLVLFAWVLLGLKFVF